MKIDETYFRALLHETMDDNPLCCRAVLSICKVEFTNKVPTLCVSLKRPSTLSVNLQFVSENCSTEPQVKALIIHEFLHILLGHTTRFKRMTPALNIALDAVINAIIHRKLGSEYSRIMTNYYSDSVGAVRLLRPISEIEHQRFWDFCRRADLGKSEQDEFALLKLHNAIYDGSLVSDDVLDLVRQMKSDAADDLLKSGKVLIGGHGQWGDPF
ncbi:MAG: hypothetical protein WEB60_07025, partial [Terrimicrobiaceae bacterium]